MRLLPSIIIMLAIVIPPMIFWSIGGSHGILAGYGACLLLLALLVCAAARGAKSRPVDREPANLTEINATGHVQLNSSEAQRNNG